MCQPRHLAFALLLAGAFGLRVACNTYLLPPLYAYPNEEDKRDAALKLPEDHFYHGSSMPSLLLDSLYLLYFPVRWTHQIGHSLWPQSLLFGMDLSNFYLWFGRVYMALFGVAAIGAVYHLGKRLHSRRVGWIAALALAVAPIHVLGSRHMKEDMPLGLFATMAMIFFLDVIRRGRLRDSKRAGFMTGICFSTKWLGGVLALPLLAAHLLRPKGQTPPDEPRPLRRRLGWAFLFLIIGFYVGSPDYLIRPVVLVRGLRRGVKKSYTEHSDGMSVSPFQEGFTDYFRTGLWPGLTPPLLVLTAIGWSGLRKRRPREAWLLGATVLFCYALLETASARPYPHHQRYLQTIIPSLAALAACGMADLDGLVRRIPALARRCSPRAGLGAIVLLALIWPTHDSLRYLYNIPRSTICQADDYIRSHVPEGSPILLDNYCPRLDKTRYRILRSREQDQLIIDQFPAEPCYALFSYAGLGRFLEHPGANPDVTRFAYYLLGTGRLVAEWQANFRSFYCESPTLRLMRFDSTEAPFVPLHKKPKE